MADLTAQRTLVKSPPELWSEVSEVASLAKHLGELGEIAITKVEPETTVAWEGELISGTVELEQSGWGTKVTFHATVPEPDPPEPDPVSEAQPEPVLEAEPEPREPEPESAEPIAKQPGFWARLFGRVPPPPVEVPEPVTVEIESVEAVVAEPEPSPEPQDLGPVPERVQEILEGTLEALGQAHHRPFSRG